MLLSKNVFKLYKIEVNTRLETILYANSYSLCAGTDSRQEHSAPQFVKNLRDETVEEGDSVTIECKSKQEVNSVVQPRAPEFTQQLSDHEVRMFQ